MEKIVFQPIIIKLYKKYVEIFQRNAQSKNDIAKFPLYWGYMFDAQSQCVPKQSARPFGTFPKIHPIW